MKSLLLSFLLIAPFSVYGMEQTPSNKQCIVDITHELKKIDKEQSSEPKLCKKELSQRHHLSSSVEFASILRGLRAKL